MRALFLYSAPQWTGSARTVAVAARGLAARGWEVVVACDPDAVVHERFAAEGAEVVTLEMAGRTLTAARKLSALIEERFVEVVFVHTDAEHTTAAIAVKLADRGAVVRRFRSGQRPRIGIRGRVAARQVPTGYLYEQGEAPAPKASSRLESVPIRLGVEPESYDGLRPAPRPILGAGASSRLIVCIYGPGNRGSASTLLRTVKLLAPRHPELRVAFVGAGSDGEDLRMHAAALGLTRTIAFLGARDDERALIRAADVGWVVAEEDTAAWAYLDCMAMQIPILADRSVHAQRYVADGIAGLLLPSAQPEVTAATVTAFLAQDDRRAAMGAAGRARVAREFSERAMVDGFERAAAAARERSAWKV